MCCLVIINKHVNDIRALSRRPPITTVEKVLETVFSVGSVPRLYSEHPWPAEFSSVAGYSPDSNDVSAGS
jgi:hypothetical protein